MKSISSNDLKDDIILLFFICLFLEKAEPKNGYIFLHNSQLFARICGRDSHILAVSLMFAEKAASIDSTSAEAMTEVGYQNLIRGRVKVGSIFSDLVDFIT